MEQTNRGLTNLSNFKNSKLRLFDVQPYECRKPLKLIDNCEVNWEPVPKRVFLFDPTPIYNRINEANVLNPFKRQDTVSIKFLFVNENNKCACGCGKELIKKKQRWATKGCSDFGYAVFAIISGYADILRQYRSIFIGGYRCEVCGDTPQYQPLELDHVYPVKFGGGGGWLSNYQFKCRRCHREKTNKDFGYKQPRIKL